MVEASYDKKIIKKIELYRIARNVYASNVHAKFVEKFRTKERNIITGEWHNSTTSSCTDSVCTTIQNAKLRVYSCTAKLSWRDISLVQ